MKVNKNSIAILYRTGKIGIAGVRKAVERDWISVEDFIDITETFQEKCIADIADQIAASKKVKVILIAGPSSSGKTTFANRLRIELLARGILNIIDDKPVSDLFQYVRDDKH